jgi:DNA adenine methylase
VGGANMIDKIKCKTRIGNDIHRELIALFKELQKGWVPPEYISEDEYKKVQNNKLSYPDYYVGYIGFQLSYGGKWFGGYRRDSIGKRNYSLEAHKNMLNQINNIQDIKFVCADYLCFNENNIKDFVVYCDPPYQNTTKYITKEFEHDVFWQWVRDTSKNNYVFVSEYNAPSDFKCIWQKEVTTSLKVKEHEERTEKLFVYNKGKYAAQYLIK